MASVKEKVIRKSIAQCEKQIKAIDEILDFSPVLEIIKAREEAQEVISRKLPYAQQYPLIKALGEREKKAFAMAEKQKKSSALISEKAKLTCELNSLNSELWFLTKALIG